MPLLPVYILTLIINSPFPGLSQKQKSFEEFAASWSKIIILDGYWGWYQFNNEYTINKSSDGLLLYAKDSLIGELPAARIDSLFLSLANPEDIAVDPLKMFGKDSLWLIKNAEVLWKSHRRANESKKVDSIAIATIQNYKLVKKIVPRLRYGSWTDDYPSVELIVISGNDSLKLRSDGQYPFMLPWKLNNREINNAELSKVIGRILPPKERSNRDRLNGEGFESKLVDVIYGNFITDRADMIRVRERYPKQLQKLENHFVIKSAALRDLESIEWGNSLGGRCLDMVLKDSTKNIQFEVILGRRAGLHSPRSLINKHRKLIKKAEMFPVFKYTTQCSDCQGSIHFVNRRSLSRIAYKNFKEDVLSDHADKRLLEKSFKNAIFFELSEDRGNETSFSRWLLLKDGTSILWQLEGKFLMLLAEDYTAEQGYVCRVVNFTDNE